MAKRMIAQEFSGAAKVWEDFAAEFSGLAEEDLLAPGALPSDGFRDEYVRIPYDDVPSAQECRW